jgi:hypothetical protein
VGAEVIPRRGQDWPERLAEFLGQRLNDPFRYGDRDCVALANDWVALVTGLRLFTPAHTDKAGADAALRERGGLAAAVTAALGAPLPTPLGASRGDIAMFDTERGDVLGIVVGEHIAAQGPAGVVYVRARRATLAWRV